MGKIQKIKDYEKIAAGEVIERPASVVKELLENSIDAGASRIEIHVEAAGTKSIKVIDNGSGIEPDEVILAFERHTTSKIREFEDIYNLSTLGFRGEALASIKAVSHVEVATRTADHELGKKVVLEEDRVLEDGDIACPVGTTMVVKKLFYNVPVRKKFLKNDSVEFSHISDIVTRYALAANDIDIKLFHDGRLVIDAPPSKGDVLNKIVAIYGKDHASSMLELNETAPDFSLHGYIASPEISRSSRGYSSLFVNSRYIYSAEVAKAIENAYGARLMKGRYPFYVLYLDIKPELIDVNIHPTKKEIKFSNEDDLLAMIEEWTRKVLDEKVKRPRVEATETSLEMHAPAFTAATTAHDASMGQEHPSTAGRTVAGTASRARQPSTKNFDQLLQEASDHVPDNLMEVDEEFNRELESDGAESVVEPVPSAAPASPARLSGWKPLVVEAGEANMESIDSGTFKVLPPLKLLSRGVQLGNTYLFFVSADGDLVIVDQHAASERVEYEKIVKNFEATGITSQDMLIPKALTLPPALIAVLEANLAALSNLGFEIVKEENDAGDIYKVTRFPFVFHVNIDFKVIEDFLEAVLSSGQLNMEDDILKLMACHAAIRSGETLDKKQVWTLLAELDKCDDPYHCCHGRPTFIVKPMAWLDKEFKRIV